MSYQQDYLTAIATRIGETVAANERAEVDANARWWLNVQTRQLATFRRRIDHALKTYPNDLQGMAALYGPNGHGAAIDDLIRDSQWHRTNGAAALILAKLDTLLAASRARLEAAE